VSAAAPIMPGAEARAATVPWTHRLGSGTHPRATRAPEPGSVRRGVARPPEGECVAPVGERARSGVAV